MDLKRENFFSLEEKKSLFSTFLGVLKLLCFLLLPIGFLLHSFIKKDWSHQYGVTVPMIT